MEASSAEEYAVLIEQQRQRLLDLRAQRDFFERQHDELQPRLDLYRHEEAVVLRREATLRRRLRRLQLASEASEATLSEILHDAHSSEHAVRRASDLKTLDQVYSMHQERQALIDHIKQIRGNISNTAEALRVGCHMDKRDPAAFFKPNGHKYERVLIRNDAEVVIDDETAELLAINDNLQKEVDQKKAEIYALHKEHRHQGLRVTQVCHQNEKEEANLKRRIQNAHNTAERIRRTATELNHENAGIMAGCEVSYASLNTQYYGLLGGPKSIELGQQRRRRTTIQMLEKVRQVAQGQVRQQNAEE